MGWYNDGEGNIIWGDLAGNEYGSDPAVNPNIQQVTTPVSPPSALSGLFEVVNEFHNPTSQVQEQGIPAFPSLQEIQRATTSGAPGSPEMQAAEIAALYPMLVAQGAAQMTPEQIQAAQYATQVLAQNPNYPDAGGGLMGFLGDIAPYAVGAIIGAGVGGAFAGGAAGGGSGASLGTVTGAAGELGVGGALGGAGAELAASTALAGGAGAVAPAGGASGGTGLTPVAPASTELGSTALGTTGYTTAPGLETAAGGGIGTGAGSAATLGGLGAPASAGSAMGVGALGSGIGSGGTPTGTSIGLGTIGDAVTSWLSGNGSNLAPQAFPWQDLFGSLLGLYGQNATSDKAKELLQMQINSDQWRTQAPRYFEPYHDAATKGIGNTAYGESILNSVARSNASKGYNMSGNTLHDLAKGLNRGTVDYMNALRPAAMGHGPQSLNQPAAAAALAGPGNMAEIGGNILGTITGNQGRTQNLWQGLQGFAQGLG